MLAGRRPTHFFDDDIYAVEMAAELKKLAAAGVSLHGSGHGQQHGLDKHWELELFVKGGFSALDALTFATISSARYLGLDRQLGSLEAGKLADLVILEANPLVDIRNSRRIDRVMLNGVLYSGKDAARVFPAPQPARPIYFLGVSNSARGWVGMPHSPGYVADEGAIAVGARAMAAVLLDRLASP